MAQHTIKSALACTVVASKGQERVEGHIEGGGVGGQGGGGFREELMCVAWLSQIACLHRQLDIIVCWVRKQTKCIRLKADA